MKNLLLMFPLMILISLLFSSCQSPMDLNTNKLIIDPLLHPVIDAITIEENGQVITFNSSNYTIKVDPNSNPPTITMDCDLNTPQTTGEYKRISVDGLKFYIYSMPMSGERIPMNFIDFDHSLVKFTWEQGINYKKDSILFSGQSFDGKYNTTDVAFTLNKDKREVWAYLHSNIYDTKSFKEILEKDTTIYKTVYDTTWIDQAHTQIGSINQRTDSTIAKTTVERLIYTPDTLFLEGKVHFSY